MNPLLKPAFMILSESAKAVALTDAIRVKEVDAERKIALEGGGSTKQRAEAFLEAKAIAKPLPGSLLAGVDKRLDLIELSGEVARLELLLKEVKNTGRYSFLELRGLSSKIEWLKKKKRERMF